MNNPNKKSPEVAYEPATFQHAWMTNLAMNQRAVHRSASLSISTFSGFIHQLGDPQKGDWWWDGEEPTRMTGVCLCMPFMACIHTVNTNNIQTVNVSTLLIMQIYNYSCISINAYKSRCTDADERTCNQALVTWERTCNTGDDHLPRRTWGFWLLVYCWWTSDC